jgi:colicin import membrane protein
MNDLFTGEPAKAKRGRKKAPAPPPQPEPEVSAPAEAGNGAELIVEDAQARAVQLFTDPKEYSEFYRRIAEEVGKHVPDTSTETGRDAIRSNAFKVTKAKTTLDKCALRLTEDWRLKTAAVNASRKIMVAELDQLAKEMRKPLTEWEALEDKRLDECRAQMEEFRTAAVIDPETDTAATLRERGKRIWEIEIDAGRYGVLFDEAQSAKQTAVNALAAGVNRLTKEEADRAELERLRAAEAARLEREETDRAERERVAAEERAAAEEAERKRVAEETRQREIREAEERAAQLARDEEARKAQEAEAQREAEREKAAATQRAAHEAELAAERARAAEAERKAQEERETRERQDRERAEAERVKREEEEREETETRRRETDRKHRAQVQKEAVESIVPLGVKRETAVKIVLAIIAGEVPNVALTF